jgi:hypothetical protein
LFESSACVTDIAHDAPKTVRTEVAFESVRETLQSISRLCARKQFDMLGIPKGLMLQEKNSYPYEIHCPETFLRDRMSGVEFVTRC